MKNKSIFVLVLGLASVSQAALAKLEVDSGSTIPTVGTAGTIQINLVADFTVTGFEMGLVASTDNSGTTDGTAGYNGPVTADSSFTAGHKDPGYSINNAQGGVALLFDVAYGAFGSVIAGNTVASFDYHIPSGWTSPFTIYMVAEDTLYIDGYEELCEAEASYASSSTSSYDIGGVTIPEPSTLLLLGFGAIRLLRRRSV
jgi:hypothetical protein